MALAQGELDEADDWLGQSLFHHPETQPVNVDEVERLALAAWVAVARHEYGRAAILLGQVQAHSRRFDTITAGWIQARVAAVATDLTGALGETKFTAALAYGRRIGSGETDRLRRNGAAQS